MLYHHLIFIFTILNVVAVTIVNTQYVAPYENVTFGTLITAVPVFPFGTIYPTYYYYNAYVNTQSIQLEVSGGSTLYPRYVAIVYNKVGLSKITTSSTIRSVWHFCPQNPTNTLIYAKATDVNTGSPNTTVDFIVTQRQTALDLNSGTSILSGSSCGNNPGPYFQFTMTNAGLGPIRIFVYHETGDTTNIGYRVQIPCSTQSSGFIGFTATTVDSINEIASNQLAVNQLYQIEMRQSGSTGDCSIAASLSQYRIGICQGVSCNINNPITTVSTTTTTTLNSVTQPILPSDNGGNTTSSSRTTNNASSKTVLVFGTQIESILILFLFLEFILYTLY